MPVVAARQHSMVAVDWRKFEAKPQARSGSSWSASWSGRHRLSHHAHRASV